MKSLTVWKNEKFSLIKEIFRQINSIVTYLVKPLLSRNFSQKCVRENSRNFHTVSLSQCGNLAIFLLFRFYVKSLSQRGNLAIILLFRFYVKSLSQRGNLAIILLFRFYVKSLSQCGNLAIFLLF